MTSVMDRRTFLAGTGAIFLATPLAAEAQPAGKAVPRIGFLGNLNAKDQTSSLTAFQQGLRDLGWIEGQTVTIDYRWAEGNPDRFPVLVAELVQLNVSVIVVAGPPALLAAQGVTSTVPIVFAVLLVDPVASGFAASLARPGGNITGLASQYEEIVGKHVQLLTDVAEYEGAFRIARSERAQAIYVLPSPILYAHRQRLVELAAQYRLPAAYELKGYVEVGGLLSYGPHTSDMYRRAASYVDRILKGAKPGDLPIERATKFELVINLKTARALGLTIPQSVLQRADEIIR